ncbi:hypothetical protein RHIZ_04730 [Rhizobium skierniewicense]|uniref:hypothetical protein n=1 Tax=Rhizobium/Agrobacterium group TaxID=227290 RepID=UPI000DE2FB53|nr:MULTISPECIES: hypothetical protein [Rhizobium/Agrobacterium group]MCI9865246.1 hypothetical protein [Rhizobium skierniewicense]NTF07676.1 hypothetical protein [Agrobacterium rubi]NTF19708.1 hypothetical protein [Agrobacterium rubi]NTF26673.1 hypothetical protein [Agrobacterium rubi]UHS56413.1 hypothetical protein HRS00_06120 [Agrobacterium vaccinii]
MTTFIITESEGDAALLWEHLNSDWDDIRVIARGSRMGAISYAKTISVNRDEPAIVVLDANTENEDSLQILRSEFHDLVMPLPDDIAPVLILGTPSISESIEEGVITEIEAFLSGADLSKFRYNPRP